MSAELIATVAVGAPATFVGIVVYLQQRQKDQTAAVRQMFTDLAAPILHRLDDLEDDMRRLKHE